MIRTRTRSEEADEGRIRSLYVIVPHFNPSKYTRREALLEQTVLHLLKHKKAAEKRRSLRMEVCVSSLNYIDSSEMDRHQGSSASGGVDACRDERGVLQFSRSSSSVVWSKENLVNIAVEYLLQHDEEAHAIGWVDGDVTFDCEDWPEAVIAALESLQASSSTALGFVQLFDRAKLLGPDGRVMYTTKSFGAQHVSGKPYVAVPHGHPEYWHPGFAWAATRKTLERLKTCCGAPLPERTLGSADRHIAMGLLGMMDKSIPLNMRPGRLAGYRAMLGAYGTELEKMALGCVEGTLRHGWHGPVASRRNMERWSILAKSAFEPEKHLTRREKDGLLVWSACAPSCLVLDVAEYFAQRNEDTLLEQPTTDDRQDGEG